MSRRQFVALASIVGASMLSAPSLALTSCKRTQLEEAQAQYRPDYTVAVIKTTTTMRSSYIEYYDDGLKMVRSIWYPYAEFGPGWQAAPAAYADELYLVPRGLMGFSDDRKVVSLNLDSGAIREYRVEQISLLWLTVDDKFFYASSNLNGVGHVSQVNKANGEAAYMDIGTSADQVVATEDGICVFWSDFAGYYDESSYYISVCDRSLSITDTVDVGAFAGGTIGWAYPTAQSDGLFYFLSSKSLAPDHTAPYKDSIYKFTVDGSRLELFYELEHETATIMLHDGRLYVFCVPRVASTDFFIEVYDCASGQKLSSLPVDYAPAQGVFHGDRLFVNGSYYLVKYRLDGDSLIEEARVTLDERGSTDDPSFHYVNGIFVRP